MFKMLLNPAWTAVLSAQHKDKTTSWSHSHNLISEQIIFHACHIKMTLDLNRISSVTAAQPQKCAAGQSQPFPQYNPLFSSSCLQVNASLEEQAFTSAWGLKAKQTFSTAFNSLSESEKKLMNKIKILGSANLPLDEREKVCFTAVIPKSQIEVFICHSNWVIWVWLEMSFFFLQYNTILSIMENIYSTAKVHPQPNISWSLEPGE